MSPLNTTSCRPLITAGLTSPLGVPVGQSSGRPYYMHSIAAEALSLAMYGEGRLDYCSLMDDSFTTKAPWATCAETFLFGGHLADSSVPLPKTFG